MKTIKYSSQFIRHYKERIATNDRLKQDFRESVDVFREDRAFVDDHALEDAMSGQRSFSVNEEYRVVYIERKEYYLFINVGTHEQVYRRS